MALIVLLCVGSMGALLLTFLALIRWVLVVVTVEHQSMAPTLQTGDRVLVARHWPRKWLRKGQIVLVRPGSAVDTALTPLQIFPYIKRIVALGEETFTLAPEMAPVSHPSCYHQADNEQTLRAWHVPPGYLFVQGEGLHSVDSRTWGPLPLNNVQGVMLMKLPRKATSSLRQSVITDWLRTGQDAPPFTAQTLSGQVVIQQDFLGSRVVFLFLIPEMIPTYTAQVRQINAAGMPLVVVSVAKPEFTHAYVADLLSIVPVLVAPRENTSFLDNYRISVTPAFCLVNEHGKIEATGFADQKKGPWHTLVAGWTEPSCGTVEKRAEKRDRFR